MKKKTPSKIETTKPKKTTPKIPAKNITKQPIKGKVEEEKPTKTKVVAKEAKVSEQPLSKTPTKKVVIKKVTQTKPDNNLGKPKLNPTPRKKSDLVDLGISAMEDGATVPIIERAGFSKTKRQGLDKYIRLASNESSEKFNEMSRKINEGLIEWSFYAIDGDLGYHYYLVLKKK